MDEAQSEQRKPTITVLRNGPNRVENVENIKNSDGRNLPHQPVTVLCRCGGSQNKPFCDGTHADVGFRDDGS